METYDKIIIGGGLYGLYAAVLFGKRGESVLVLEYDEQPFQRATYINQARIHMGYHYPRSYSTAIKSAHYFNRFVKDFEFCIASEFEKVYATSATFSWTDANQFVKFCRDADIMCLEINPEQYFKPGLCDGAYVTKEYAFDAQLLKQYYMDEIAKYSNIDIKYNVRIETIEKDDRQFEIITKDRVYYTEFLVNATYASTNQITSYLGFEPFKIKYELCEMIICDVSDALKDVGITVMDGPFFSIMPFGKTMQHSLTSVTFTPHKASFETLPTFECQNYSEGHCSPTQLGNCNTCIAKPKTAYPYMSSLARKYLKEEYGFTYSGSLFSMKPVLVTSEIDDSRPTLIHTYCKEPTYVNVLSGKINTVYDLDKELL